MDDEAQDRINEEAINEGASKPKNVRCGCVLHAGKDHSRVRGCPSVYIDNLLEANAKLAKALMAIRGSLDYLFSGELDKYIE